MAVKYKSKDARASQLKSNALKEVKGTKITWKKDIMKNWQVYLLYLPALVMTVVLHYIPMTGILMAFEDYEVTKGWFQSKWVGMQNFVTLFTGEEFQSALRNTIFISIIKCTLGFAMPILFAFLLSSLKSKKYKRSVQTFSYLPNFVAAVVVCSLLREFIAKDGPLTLLLSNIFGLTNQNWLAQNTPVFWFIYVAMGIWQGIGWGSIMYVAAIATVNGDLHEAAAIDGATRAQRVFRITLPCIMPTIVMMFVLNVGLSFSTGFDSILLLYMPSTYKVADTVYTYTYRMAFTSGTNYGLSAASGLFQSIVGTCLLIGSNFLSKKISKSSLF